MFKNGLFRVLLLIQVSFSLSAQYAVTLRGLTANDATGCQLEVEQAVYYPSKGFLPYLTVAKTTGYTESATPELKIITTALVSEPYLSAIQRSFGKYLTSDFALLPLPSLVKNENLNQYHLCPFRIYNGRIEQLVTYNVNWKVSARLTPNAAQRSTPNFTTSSVLASGKWYKIGTTQTGLHKITRNQLAAMGINVTQLDPRQIRLYGNGGAMLPEANGDSRLDDLSENAIFIAGESDGSFDTNDYILFYATGTNNWKYTPSGKLKYSVTKSLYSDSSFYFITTDLGAGKRVQTQSSLSNNNITTNSYDYYNFHEANLVNFAKSGRQWFGEYFDIVTSYNFNWTEGDFVVGDTVNCEAGIVANYNESSSFSVVGNGVSFNITTGGIAPGQYAAYGDLQYNRGKALNNNSSALNFVVTKNTSKSIAWMDKITVNARRNLVIGGKQFCFRDSRVVGAGKIANFQLLSGAGNPIIWNVTDPIQPFIQAFNTNGTAIDFNAESSSIQEYCAALASDLFTPAFVKVIDNQNLHSITGANYLIITHPFFINESNKLGAFHARQDNLSYSVVSTEDIYNEFSSGKQDASAIRDFIRMVYWRSKGTSSELKYVLLMGDGSYNNLVRNPESNSNMIPTYQSNNSLFPTQSIATDDFYGLMDDAEGYNAEGDFSLPAGGKMDIAIGRIPCRNASEAAAVVNKIEHYYETDPEAANGNASENSTMGDWRNWLLFVADDGDGALHMRDANRLIPYVTSNMPYYNFDKIFLDAYQRISTPGGSRYPEAAADFVKRINKGALIFNYTGHGGEVGLTAERLIDVEMINGFENFNKLPLFITATCEFSRYDDPARTSAGELCLLNIKGGAIALLTTCRVAYSNSNFDLNSLLLDKLFLQNRDGSMPTLGDAIFHTKSTLSQQWTYANFHLLGDPALRLNYPKYRVYTWSVNGQVVKSNRTDTLAALSKITINGYVGDGQGNKLNTFNGVVYPTVFDKEQSITCLVNDRESAINYSATCDTCKTPFVFKQQKNMLYRGKVKVTNGEFTFSFIVPKDISFSIGPGNITYYGTNGTDDANGSFKNVVVGGASRNAITDNEGPQIKLYMNDPDFISGGMTNQRPILYAQLTDSSGINTVGTGLGHDITAILNQNVSSPVIMNDYYEANLNSYQSGKVAYPFSDLAAGSYNISFKAWDILNNSGTASLDFVVAPDAAIALDKVLNYPNPFTTRTTFLFQHNQAFVPLKVQIQIYTISGKLVKTLAKTLTNEGFNQEGVEWDGRDDYGDKLARGVYVYKISITAPDNTKAEKIEKLVILN